MAEPVPGIDFANLPVPDEGILHDTGDRSRGPRSDAPTRRTAS
jgi:hypothetical protein